MSASLAILTGASGAGKSALARHFLEHYSAYCDVFCFDSIGVPPVEKMEADYGSGEAWQRAMTVQWMTRIRSILYARRPVLFEGQMRIAFIREALTANKIASAHIVLIDCDDDTRAARLHLDRSQPELANPTMMNWARYLREEAFKFGLQTLDTGRKSFDHCIARLKPLLLGEQADE